MFLLELLMTGTVAGFVGALTGLGGAVVITPVLSLLFGVPIEYAAGASLVATIATSSGAAVAYIKDGIVNLKIGMSLEIATTIGAIIGSFLAAAVYANNLAYIIFIIFGAVLLSSLYPTIKKGYGHKRTRTDWSTDVFQMKGVYYDKATKKRVKYAGSRWHIGESIMFVAGTISGLLGVGSGVLKVLALDSAMRLPIKVSTATSDFMIGVTAVTGSAIYWALGYIQPMLVAPVIVGVLLGAYFGTKTMQADGSSQLRSIFVIVLAIVAVEMILRGIGVA